MTRYHANRLKSSSSPVFRNLQLLSAAAPKLLSSLNYSESSCWTLTPYIEYAVLLLLLAVVLLLLVVGPPLMGEAEGPQLQMLLIQNVTEKSCFHYFRMSPSGLHRELVLFVESSIMHHHVSTVARSGHTKQGL